MANKIYLIPPMHTKGLIKLAAPFTNAVVATAPYRIAAARSLSDIGASGEDPYAKYYQPAGISEEKYLEDLSNGVVIISLQSSTGQWVYVPNSYLTQMPQASGVPYTVCLLGVNLGALPNSIDLTYFKDQVRTLANDLLGVTDADVQVVAASETSYLDAETAKTVETARSNVMSIVKTDRAKLIESENARLAAVQRIAELETFILANLPPP